ncbi:hypothetical protein HRED_10132 [Candidatus Haloredivivus sp. G17]|nr:hypothetical protein HRED_10132 [Candidatus Haloredivivus sp. G17]
MSKEELIQEIRDLREQVQRLRDEASNSQQDSDQAEPDRGGGKQKNQKTRPNLKKSRKAVKMRARKTQRTSLNHLDRKEHLVILKTDQVS